MEPATQPFSVGEIKAQLAKIKYDQKWEVLKPVIRKMWMEDDRKLSELIKDIQTTYGFVAQEPQYKYHFKKWKWKRNISTPKKEALCNIRATRAQAGRSSLFEHQGKVVDEKKLRRHMKDTIHKENSVVRRPALDVTDWKAITGSSFTIGNSIFLNWTRPYGTRVHLDRAVSSPMSLDTPSDILVATPPANITNSPSDALSPFTQVSHRMKVTSRAYMLVEGKYAALIASMGREEQVTMSTWLYQFWMYAFKTTKYWGRGPRHWTADLLKFENFKATDVISTPRSPVAGFENMLHEPFHSAVPQSFNQSLVQTKLVKQPSPLCRWSIHYKNKIKYERCRSPTPSPESNIDESDEAAWKPWPSSETGSSLHETLTQGLGGNTFSNVASENLPIAYSIVAQALETSEHESLEETLGFSIISRNFGMVEEILREYWEAASIVEWLQFVEKIQRIKPYHLAVTYLDGFRACCAVINALIGSEIPFRASDTNNLGHTIFDCLMMTILKAHTGVTPGEVDDGLRDEKNFPGEEIDICGRFDADSDCVRCLVAAGKTGIPFTWKHKFCHTSAQAICHSILALMWISIMTGDKPFTDEPSGVFLKRCVGCGLKMQLKTLHTLVLTAFQLGQSGAKDEDLFGMIAVLLCVLRSDTDPLVTADVSVATLYPDDASSSAEILDCSHEPLRVSQMAEHAWQHTHKWSSEAKIGWAIFCEILRIAERAWEAANEMAESEMEENEMEESEMEESEMEESEMEERKSTDCDCVICRGPSKFSKDARLPTLYAAVQTELLTYRRLRGNDPWISPNFDMESVLRSLQAEEPFAINLIQQNMMQTFCKSGCFESDEEDDPLRPRAEHVMKYHFSNLEDWSRTTFLLPTSEVEEPRTRKLLIFLNLYFAS